MIEYAITAGEGTLLAYGVAEWISFSKHGFAVCDPDGDRIWYFERDSTIIASPCSDDCETGQ